MSFTEQQKFNQWWLWALLLVISVVFSYALIQQEVFNIPFGDKPAPTWVLALILILFVGLGLLLKVFTLNTKINSNEISFSFKPLVSRKYTWEEINAIKIIDYGFVGGWGIRLGSKYGTVYNMRGSKGLQVTLVNNKQFVIGTQTPEALKAYLLDLPEANKKFKSSSHNQL
jgi:hypothetical protein